MAKAKNTVELKKRFLRLLLPPLILYSLLTTVLFVGNDFRLSEASRKASQKLIFDTFYSSIRQPLLQGSTVEAEIRAGELEKNPQVACVEIISRDASAVQCKKNLSKLSSLNTLESDFHFSETSSPTFAKLRITFDNSDLRAELLSQLGRFLAAFSALGVLLYLILSRGFDGIRGEFSKVLNQARGIEEKPEFHIAECKALSDSLLEHMTASQESAEARAVAEVSRQVAHDIRSPLAALKSVVKAIDGATISELSRKTLELAVRRIVEVSNDLGKRKDISELDNEAGVNIPALINTAVHEIVAEKRAQIPSGSIVLNEAFDERIPLVGRISSSIFKRIVSNLLDNSIQAMPGSGTIRIEITETDACCKLQIFDDGVGIPKEILPKLFERGATYGKPGGKGLGLYWARNALSDCGGTISIESIKNRGSVVTVLVPIDRSDLIASKIAVATGQKVLCIDDDISIYHAWKLRPEWAALGVHLGYWDGAGELPLSTIEGTDLFLVDFDRGPVKRNGLELIVDSRIQGRAILVTSKYENPRIRQTAMAVNVPILPKDAIESVQIESI